MKIISLFLLLSVIGLLLFFTGLSYGQSDSQTDSTFTVYLPKLGYPPDDEGQGWDRPLVWGRYDDDAYDDEITIPNGRPIYALFVSGYSKNDQFDEIYYYNFARHLQAHGAYVHFAWWNNLLAPYMERPLHYKDSYPGNSARDLKDFLTLASAQYKAIPGEDYQFLADAKRLLRAIRQNNPDAIIIAVGHSLGGAAVVHLGSQTNVRIDILAPIDPVGNRNYPWRYATHVIFKDYNWTRWRVTRDKFLGYKAKGFLCNPDGPWWSLWTVARNFTPPYCFVKTHAAPTLRFGNNIVHLYHRWQGEFLYPFDYKKDYWFLHNRPPGGSTSQREIKMKGFLDDDPGGWPRFGNNDAQCCPEGNGVGWNDDGHGEIVGYRGPLGKAFLATRTRTSPNCGDQCPNLIWPIRERTLLHGWVDPDSLLRRDLLRALETIPSDSLWEHRPYNPDLCLVSAGLIRLFDRINSPSGVPGSITGKVTIDGTGTPSVTVKILDAKDSTNMVDVQTTDENGDYSINNILPGSYKVMIEEPLGYEANQNYVPITLADGQNVIVNFDLTSFITSNNAKGKGYWKHQFNVYVNGRGNAQETEAELENYIDLVDSRYNPEFSIFYNATDDSADFQNWLGILSVQGNEGMLLKATSHLAASVMNVMSLKLAQYEIVTEDSMTAGDVLTYVSFLIDDEDSTNDALAKDLAEHLNEKLMIAAGLVPPSGILYRGGNQNGSPEKSKTIPLEFSLEQNYPNPFNPSTTIRYSIPKAELVTLKIYDLLGREITILVREQKLPGSYEYEFDAVGFTSGIYFYKFQAGSYIQTKKMVLLK